MKLFFALLLFCRYVLAGTVTLDWSIGWKWLSPDGTPRPVIVVNDQWPPPTITVNEGDRLVVHVTNNLGNETTSIHFHGMYMKGAPEMDGASGATQCPVPPSSTFTYDFKIDQVGTYWWHAHDKAQILDGLRGPMVVKAMQAPYENQVDGGELVITMGDWYHQQAPDLLRRFLSKEANAAGRPEPVPDSGLINSGRDVKFPVQPDKTYLLRVINTGNNVAQSFEIDGHDLTIVEADGIYVEPYKVDRLYLAVAQRYAVLLKTKKAPTVNYLIKCQMDTGLFSGVPADYNPGYYGYLMYDSSKELPPRIPIQGAIAFDDMDLVTSSANRYDQVEVYGKVDRQITMDLSFTTIDGMTRALINNSTYLTPKVPTLYTALTVGAAATNPLVYGPNSNPYIISSGEVVEIRLVNHDTRPHPFHLHGHTFQLISRSPALSSSSSSSSPATGPDSQPGKPAAPRPLRRDTVVLPASGSIAVRFLADNPGIHLWHCHIAFHVEAGMTATMVESPDRLQRAAVDLPRDHLEACERLGMGTRGNAAGDAADVLDLAGARVTPEEPTGAVVRGGYRREERRGRRVVG